MNWYDKIEAKERLMKNLADHMVRHGEIRRDDEQSNEYTCVRIIELNWRGKEFTITQVDGMTCRIDRD